MRNVEIKAKIRNLLKLMEAVNNLKPVSSEIINQHDTFYNVSHGRLKLRDFTDDTGELIFYERPDHEGPKISLYEKTAISGCKDVHRVLNKALGSKQIVKKHRQETSPSLHNWTNTGSRRRSRKFGKFRGIGGGVKR
ncbi:unnamed protein product [Phyllotreta striolata]|uniref:CYTH domain-containing protein n=1 Tax=Phyllotreta striolata TaxID=444603 RepID=A0A9N9TJI7_PHYSR|nr:unnamed protein product [Phyllotreta striolata]